MGGRSYRSPALLAMLLSLTSGAACREHREASNANHPAEAARSAPDTDKIAHLRNSALACMEAELNPQAINYWTELAARLPNEPMIYANRAFAELRGLPADSAARQAGLERAAADIERVNRLAPNDAHTRLLEAGVWVARNDPEKAAPLLAEAVRARPDNVRLRYLLVQQLRAVGESTLPQRIEHLERLARQVPRNLVIRLTLIEDYFRSPDAVQAAAHLDAVAQFDMVWPKEPADTRALLETTRQKLAERDVPAARSAFTMLNNVLKRSARYQKDVDTLPRESEPVGEIMWDFATIKLPPAPAPATVAVKFKQLPENQRLIIGSLGREPLAARWLEDRPQVWPTLVTVDRDIARLYERSLDGHYDNPALSIGLTSEASALLRSKETKSSPAATPSAARTGLLATADWNQDGRLDLIYAGDDGQVYFLARTPEFEALGDRPATGNVVVQLPDASTPAPVRWILPFDADQDGDLDFLVGRAGTRPVLLRYNGDGTFAETAQEMGLAIEGAPGFVAGDIGDLDDDGDLDVLAIDEAGRLRWFDNRRAGKYALIDSPAELQAASAVTIADLNSDGLLDIALLKPDGALLVAVRGDDGQYSVQGVAQIAGKLTTGPSSVQTWDFDNDGALDLLVVRQGTLGEWRNASQPGEK
ncbi:MAG TPA: FG-GAP-like repeat-containing protein, partial [Phycisphaerae bacterium]